MNRKEPQPLPELYRTGKVKPMKPSPTPPPKGNKTYKAKPESLNILGNTYKITYCDKPSEVDLFKRDSLWGQIDFWTRTIRVYDNGRSVQDIWETIIHEVLHAIGDALKLDILDKGAGEDKNKHEQLDILALALTDTLFRNDLIKV